MAAPTTIESSVLTQEATLAPALRVKLSVMMFLQYAIWGSWWVVLGIYLQKLGFTGAQVTAVYATTAIASIFSPMIFGQIADRWVATEYLLVGLHLIGAAVLYLATRFSEFTPLYTCVLIYAFLYIPTISLTNSLSLHNIPNAGKYFPGIRVFGTIGWIAAGLVVGQYLDSGTPQPIMLACGLSVVTGLFCLLLPHTPPVGVAGEALPFLKALGLLKDRTFALFFLVSFIISIVLAGYYAFTGMYLANIGVKRVAAVMTIAQVAEMVLLPFLPFFLNRLGMKWTLAIGMAAWGVRYAIFALGEPLGLVISSLALHGLCYDFFFVAAYIHVDNKAGVRIRASAQALFNLVVMGLGMWIGNIYFGWLYDHFILGKAGTWADVWIYPCIGVVLALAVFLVSFKSKPAAASATC